VAVGLGRLWREINNIQMHTILIIEDHPMMVDAIKASVQGLPIKTIVFTASSLKELRNSPRLAGLKTPSLIVADLNLPDSQGVATVKHLRVQYPESVILVFSQSDDPLIEAQVMAKGAAGFVSKSYQPKVFLERLRRVVVNMQGKLPDGQASEVTLADEPLDELTVQQRKVLSLLASGQTNLELAAQLEVTESTIRTHLSEIYRRLGVKSRTQATVLYLQWASQHDER
jgi:DNA-binding NarL/FixJ family response regulator